MESDVEIAMLKIQLHNAEERESVWETLTKAHEFQHELTKGDVRHIMSRATKRQNMVGFVTEFVLSADDWHELCDVVEFEG